MLKGDRKQIKSYEDLEVYQESFELVMNEKPPTPNTQDPRPKKEGFALIFTILILVGMLAASLVISSIILRVAHSVGKITDSEIAYYGAETAAEKVLYKINKEYKNVVNFNPWKSEAEGRLDSNAEYSLTDIKPEEVTSFSKPSLAGESLQLDLDLNGVDYPDSLNISGSGSLVIVEFELVDGEMRPVSQIEEPLEGSYSLDIDHKYYKLRILSEEGGNIIITPDSGTLTIGTIITTKGSYRGTERILETKNPKWQIY